MSILYKFISFLSPAIYALLGLFDPKVHKINQGRKGALAAYRSFATSLAPDAKCYWFHAASLGEYLQLLPVMRYMKQQDPSLRVLHSFFSPSGFEQANDPVIDLKFYLPADHTSSYVPFFRLHKPQAIVFSKYDLWPAFIQTAYQAGIPMHLAGAELASLQRYFTHQRGFFYRLLNKMTTIATNTQATADILQQHGFMQAVFTGSPKIAQASELPALPFQDTLIEQFIAGRQVLIGGSVWSREIQLLAALPDDPGCCYLIAPHELSTAMINEITTAFGARAIRLSGYMQGAHKVLIIDRMGILSRLYRYGDIALVGGGFGRGIHNILEPAAYGLPVLSGPKNNGFSEATQLLELGSYFTVENDADFSSRVRNLLNNTQLRLEIKNKLDAFFTNNSDAVRQIAALITPDTDG